jgi:hypothetical protein
MINHVLQEIQLMQMHGQQKTIRNMAAHGAKARKNIC